MADKKNRRGLFPLLLGAILLIVGLVGAHGEDTLLQYAVRAPMVQTVKEEDKDKISPNQALAQLTDSLDKAWEELTDVTEYSAVVASASGVNFAGEGGESATASLHALRGDAQVLYPKYLTSGRLFQPQELTLGDKVMLLDERLAIALFAVSDPVDRYVKLGEDRYRVIGIVRHSRSVGDMEEYGAYVPLSEIEKGAVQMDMITVSIRPVPKSGALSAFSSAMKSWQPGGNVYDLDKEAMRVGIWGRFALVGLGLYLVLFAFHWLSQRTILRVMRFREDLRIDYLKTLLPRFALDCALLLLGFMATLGACAGLTIFALQPVYVFPEWIPTVLVEWEDIRSVFWNLTGEAAQPIQCLTPEMARIRFFAHITNWGLLCFLFGLAAK